MSDIQDFINATLQIIAEEDRQKAIDNQYMEMIDSYFAEMEMLEYAARSYDNDVEAYAEMY